MNVTSARVKNIEMIRHLRCSRLRLNSTRGSSMYEMRQARQKGRSTLHNTLTSHIKAAIEIVVMSRRITLSKVYV